MSDSAPVRNPFDPTFEQLPETLPIFPLSGVLLLPGGKLPLNIFEPRYLAMLEALGVPGASSLGPAFIVLKRVKEAICVAIGFVILARLGPRQDLAAAKEEVAAQSS